MEEADAEEYAGVDVAKARGRDWFTHNRMARFISKIGFLWMNRYRLNTMYLRPNCNPTSYPSDSHAPDSHLSRTTASVTIALYTLALPRAL